MCPAEAGLFFFLYFYNTKEIMEDRRDNGRAARGSCELTGCLHVTCQVEQDADKFVPEIRYF